MLTVSAADGRPRAEAARAGSRVSSTISSRPGMLCSPAGRAPVRLTASRALRRATMSPLRAPDRAHRPHLERVAERRALDGRRERPEHLEPRLAPAPARCGRARRLRAPQLGTRRQHAAPERAFPEPRRPRRPISCSRSPTSQCRYASNSVLRMIDCTEAAVLGDGIIDFVHPDDRERAAARRLRTRRARPRSSSGCRTRRAAGARSRRT